MVDINPGLQLLVEIKTSLENGMSVRTALNKYLNQEADEFRRTVRRWQNLCESKRPTQDFLKNVHSPYRRTLFEVLEAGLNGQPIYESLNQLESEYADACYDEIERALKRIPFLTMIPLLLFMFPAFLLLLLGPIVSQLIKEMS